MLRTNKRQNFTDEALEDAVSAVGKKVLSINRAAKKYGIPRSTLQRYIDLNEKKSRFKLGRRPVLNEIEERSLIEALVFCAGRGFPLKLSDIRHIVKNYLDASNKTVDLFNNNLPGEKWIRTFMKRHPELRTRFGKNSKIDQTESGDTNVKNHFNQSEKESKKVYLHNSKGYEETGFVNDSITEKMVVQEATEQFENISEHSISNVPAMFVTTCINTLSLLSQKGKHKSKRSQESVVSTKKVEAIDDLYSPKTVYIKEDENLKAKMISEEDNFETTCIFLSSSSTATSEESSPLLASLPMNSPNVKVETSIEERIAFEKNDFLAVRNSEERFYICQLRQNLKKTESEMKIRWFTNLPSLPLNIYGPHFCDVTESNDVLTKVEMIQVETDQWWLPNRERARIEDLLRKTSKR